MEYIAGTITLQAIFLQHWTAYCAWYKGVLREAVVENVLKIMHCRTFQLGYHMFQCPQCSSLRLIPHSCKSRFCSSCGKIATDRWTEERLSDVLDVGYHHIVFTVPWQLRAICLLNRKCILNILFSAAAFSLLSWTKTYGGYIPGCYTVLHTFGSDLKFHPHLHILITAGGLSTDKRKWIAAPDNYLIPEKGLKKRWRFAVISGLVKANTQGLLQMPFLEKKGEHINLRGVISVISKLSWYIFIGSRLLEIGMSVRYIGRYTKKPVIAETRIIRCDNRWVIFKYKDYAHGGKQSVKKMRLFTFITYLTQHIPDKGFRVVRAYGIFSNHTRGKLLPIAKKLCNHTDSHEVTTPSWRERQTHYANGKDPLICDRCQKEMVLINVSFGPPPYSMMRILGFKYSSRIPQEQICLNLNTS